MALQKLNTFEKLFRELFKPLCNFSLKYISDQDDAKGLVHEVFVLVWEKFDNLPVDTNFQSYLYTAVRNRCLNYIRDKKKNVMIDSVPEQELIPSYNTSLETSELEKEIEIGIASLPEKCRIVFEMNRQEGLRYAQIAERMGISVKTVEAHMSKALTMLRQHLGEFLCLIFLILKG